MSSPTLRIIGGTLKGRKVAVPKGFDVRPMRSRVRESLFGILIDRLPAARVLDVFAGSGAISFEALSRGADHATLIENDRRVLAILDKNIKDLGLASQTTIDRRSAYSAPPEGRFDLIFLDPPFPHYESPHHDPWQLAKDLSVALTPDGLICVEYPSRLSVPEATPLVERDRRKYGDTSVVLFGLAEA